MTTGSRRLHDVCWLNLMTPAAAQAKEFFAALLGWTYAPMDDAPGGTLILVEGKHAGALMDLDAGVLPPGTPPAIVRRLNEEINRVLATEPMRQQFAAQNMATPPIKTVEQFAATVKSDIELWQSLGRTAKLQID